MTKINHHTKDGVTVMDKYRCSVCLGVFDDTHDFKNCFGKEKKTKHVKVKALPKKEYSQYNKLIWG